MMNILMIILLTLQKMKFYLWGKWIWPVLGKSSLEKQVCICYGLNNSSLLQ